MTPPTPDERAHAVYLAWHGSDWLPRTLDLRSIEPMIAAAIREAEHEAVLSEREACALACDAIATDKHDQYKGRGRHAPTNENRAATYTEGESDGADLCAAAIRARTESEAT